MPLTPGLRPFYKYASPDTAIAILESGNVRYSNPLDFNDPFDIQTNLHFDFDLASLCDRVIDRLETYANQDSPPPVDPEEPWGRIALEVHSRMRTYGFPKASLAALVGSQFGEITQVLEETRQGIVRAWKEVLLPSVRVFCVTEKNDNLLMWAHYGRDHTGAVFEMWSLPELDNPLSVAQKVQYSSSPPGFFSVNEFVDDLFTISRLDPQSLSRRYVYAKSSHWEYEQEWRVWYPLSTSPRYDDMPIRSEELKAIYLGCRSSEDFRTRVRSLRDQKFPAAKLFITSKHENLYALEHTSV